MKEVGVVIVTHNSAEVIGRCLDACSGYDAVVVDNASRDGTVAEVQRRFSVGLIENTANLGFAGAVNQGIASLSKEFILLLNPDVELISDVGPLVDACRQPSTAIASGQLLGVDGEIQAGFTIRRFPTPWSLTLEVLGINRIWPGNPVNRHYRYVGTNLELAREVEQPAGALLLFRRSLWIEVAGFDTRFHPLWFEDVDFCKRARDLGWKAQYLPPVKAKHLGGHSISKLEWAHREVYWYASLLKYASKHFRTWAFRGVSAAVVLGSIFRSVWEVVTRRSIRPVKVYAGIGRLAVLSMIKGRA